MAGNGGYDGPNVHLVQYAFDNTWSVDALETYVTHYQPEGVPLRTLRHALGHHNPEAREAGHLPGIAGTRPLPRPSPPRACALQGPPAPHRG